MVNFIQRQPVEFEGYKYFYEGKISFLGTHRKWFILRRKEWC